MADVPMKVVDGVTMPMTEEEIAQMAAFAESADLDFDHFIRPERNGLLAGSDWTQLEDAPLSDEEKTEWTTYRQSLRDLPSTADRVSLIVWPTTPS